MADGHRCLAVVPARGGSKGLPGKNIRPLAGLPLLVHSLRCAALAPGITRTIVSTDSAEIAEVARAHGADVPFLRPAELATDSARTMPVLAHAVGAAEQDEGLRYDSVLLLEPTSPTRLPEDIERALALFEADESADSVIACSRPAISPFWVGVVLEGDYLRPAFPEVAHHVRRQDVAEYLRINGALYLYRRPSVERPASELSRSRLLEIPEARAFSIDEVWEFSLLEALLAAGLLRFPWLSPRERPAAGVANAP